MTADDRRAAILQATVPLLRARGMNVTTRELAEAACVAEGTLFRVFPDKDALVRAAIAQALDPAPLVEELEGLDPELGLREAVRRAVEVMLARSRDVVALLSLAYGHADDQDAAAGPRSHPHGHAHAHAHHGGQHPVQVVVEAVTALLTRHGGEGMLRREPAVCARMLVGIVFVSARPPSPVAGASLHAEEIVDLFLDGAMSTAAPEHQPPSHQHLATSHQLPSHEPPRSEESC